MRIWDLDDNRGYNTQEVKRYMAKHGYNKNTHPDFKIGDIVEFMTGYNNDIRAKASIKGINGNDIYVYDDCYWFPIKTDKILKIERIAA